MPSEAWRTLRQSQREVKNLYADVHAAWMLRDWGANVYARHTLGDNVQVEAWYLAEHFLLAWSDWHGLKERYLRYFGQPRTKVPNSWDQLDVKCRGLASGLFSDQTLGGFVQQSWSEPLGGAVDQSVAEPDPRQLFHALVNQHRQTEFMRTASAPWQEWDFPQRPRKPREPRKPRLEDKLPPRDVIPYERATESYEISVAPRFEAEFATSGPAPSPPWIESMPIHRHAAFLYASQRSQFPYQAMREARWYLQNYRHATLEVSWLINGDRPTLLPPPGASAMGRRDDPWQERFIETLEVSVDERQTARRVLQRIQTAIAEVGFQNFASDLTSGDFLGGPDTLVGSEAVNVIPGPSTEACYATALAISRSDKRPNQFPIVMQQVREQLTRCMGKTKAVIVVCDHWRTEMLAEHITDLRAHHDRGVRFLFLLVGMPDTELSPVAVDLGQVV